MIELTLYEVIQMIDLNAHTIYVWEKKGVFPKRFKIGKRYVRWHLNEIEWWIKNNPKRYYREKPLLIPLPNEGHGYVS